MHEYLPWGGLLYPQVVRNKDGSLMGFIEYTTIRDDIPDAVGKEKIDEFPRGWALWIEQQHFEGEYQRVITLLWQPHIDKKNQRVLNTLDDRPLLEPETGKYFVRVLKDLCTDLSATVFAQILTGSTSFPISNRPSLVISAIPIICRTRKNRSIWMLFCLGISNLRSLAIRQKRKTILRLIAT